jgi:hypothetical protein
VRSLGAALDTSPPLSPDLIPVPLAAALADASSQTDAILAICREAGFPDAEHVTTEAMDVLVGMTRRVNGELRHLAAAKARWRVFRPAIGAAKALAQRIPELAATPPGLVLAAPLRPSRLDLIPTIPEIESRPVAAWLPTLLERFGEGLARLVAAEPRRPAGAPATSDALREGVERLDAVWRAHHPRMPNLGRKRGGFVIFVSDVLGLALDANGAAASKQVSSTTLVRLVRHRLEQARAG